MLPRKLLVRPFSTLTCNRLSIPFLLSLAAHQHITVIWLEAHPLAVDQASIAPTKSPDAQIPLSLNVERVSTFVARQVKHVVYPQVGAPNAEESSLEVGTEFQTEPEPEA
jgi:hypothetical protein